MKIQLSFYRCSGCPIWSKYLCEIKKHCDDCKKCKGQIPVKEDIEQEFEDRDDFPPLTPIARLPSGPKPVDMKPILHGRCASFRNDKDDASFAKRCDYLFNTPGLLESCITTQGIDERIGNLFSVLYGHRAPKQFQSIVMHKNKVFAVDETDEDGTTHFSEYPSIHQYINESDFYKKFLMRVEEICNLSVRREGFELTTHIDDIRNFILQKGSRDENFEMSLFDAFEKNDKYRKCRKTYDTIVKNARLINTVVLKEFLATQIITGTKLPLQHTTSAQQSTPQ